MLPATVVCRVKRGWTYISQQDKEVMTDNGFCFLQHIFPLRMATSQWQSLNLPQCPIAGVHSSVNLFLEHPESTSLALILCLSINSESGPSAVTACGLPLTQPLVGLNKDFSLLLLSQAPSFLRVAVHHQSGREKLQREQNRSFACCLNPAAKGFSVPGWIFEPA